MKIKMTDEQADKLKYLIKMEDKAKEDVSDCKRAKNKFIKDILVLQLNESVLQIGDDVYDLSNGKCLGKIWAHQLEKIEDTEDQYNIHYFYGQTESTCQKSKKAGIGIGTRQQAIDNLRNLADALESGDFSDIEGKDKKVFEDFKDFKEPEGRRPRMCEFL